MTSSTPSTTNQAPKILIQSSRFGEVEIDADKIITMTTPFLGFPNEKRFVLMPHSDESVFWWLQAVDNPALAFVVIQPARINPQYAPVLHPSAIHELQASGPHDLELLIILTVPKGKPEEMTANLLGPIALNAAKRYAKQILLDPGHYSPCWPVFEQK